jgi:hypothetical protein
VCVLLTAEDEFGLALTLSRRSPHGKCHAEQDGHDAQGNQQRRHRVAALAGRHGRLIRISVVAEAVLPSTIRRVTVTVNVPSAVYTCEVEPPDVVTSTSSPKSHEYDSMVPVSVTPIAVAVNVQRWPAVVAV